MERVSGRRETPSPVGLPYNCPCRPLLLSPMQPSVCPSKDQQAQLGSQSRQLPPRPPGVTPTAEAKSPAHPEQGEDGAGARGRFMSPGSPVASS